jgi:hypothetical protein
VTAGTAVRAAGVAAALALAGCPLHPRAPIPTPTQGEWAAARDAATRRALLYDGLNHRATGTATLLSPAVREARARRLAEWFGWTPTELDDRLAREHQEAAAGEEFLLSFYTADPRDDDLDAPRSVWRVAVKADGADVVASRITSIERDATVLGLFPFIGPFDTVYQVFVPHPPVGPLTDRPFVLEVASARGRLALDYAKPNGPMAPWEPAPPP